MKTITITTIIVALITIPIIIKRAKARLLPIYRDENKRYDINDYIEASSL